MTQTKIEIAMSRSFRKATIVSGTILLLIGLAGILLPQVMTIALSVLMAWLFIGGGLMVGCMTWLGHRTNWLAWLKTFVLILLGLLIAFNPLAGAAALGLILSVYFFLDGFAGLSLAFHLRPVKGWIWMLINGLLSLGLGVVFIIGWPFSALWLVGLFVGISLFLDGASLLILGLASRPL